MPLPSLAGLEQSAGPESDVVAAVPPSEAETIQLLTTEALASSSPTAFGEDSLPHSDDIQLSHSFLDPGRKAVCGLGLGVWMSKRRFFPHCPVALNLQPLFSFSTVPSTHLCQNWTSGFCLGG